MFKGIKDTSGHESSSVRVKINIAERGGESQGCDNCRSGVSVNHIYEVSVRTAEVVTGAISFPQRTSWV